MLSIEDIRPWKGLSSGRVHVDFLGVLTNPAYWHTIKPSRAGRLTAAHPGPGDLYLEYAACVMAATYGPPERGFVAAEIGAAWGVWAVRAAAVARAVKRPCRVIAIEPLTGNCANLRQHFVMNGLDTRCHDIVEAAIGPEAGECWIRYGDDFDIGARVVNEDWVKRHAALPLTSVPVGLEIPCRDSYRVVKKRQLPITDFVNQNEIVDFVHVRVGGGPDRVLGFQPHNLGLIVFAMLSDTDAAMVSKEMQARRLTPICRAAKGEVVVTQRGTNPLRGAFHVYAGDAVPMEQQMAMNARFASLIKPRL